MGNGILLARSVGTLQNVRKQRATWCYPCPILGHMGTCVAIGGDVGPSGAIWGHIALYGSSWPIMDHMGPHDPTWCHMEPYGAIWGHEKQYTPYAVICRHLVPYGATWCQRLPNGPYWAMWGHVGPSPLGVRKHLIWDVTCHRQIELINGR